MDVGTDEGKETVENARRMCALLQQKGYRPGQELWYVEEQNAEHCEAAWSARLRHALQFLLLRARPQQAAPSSQPSELIEIALGSDA